MESSESLPYDEIELVCQIVGVEFHLYNLKRSLERVIESLQRTKGLPVSKPFPDPPTFLEASYTQ